jgi:hypothetical protein
MVEPLSGGWKKWILRVKFLNFSFWEFDICLCDIRITGFIYEPGRVKSCSKYQIILVLWDIWEAYLRVGFLSK